MIRFIQITLLFATLQIASLNAIAETVIFEVEPQDLIILVDGERTSEEELRILDLSPGLHDVTIIADQLVGGAKFSIFGDKIFYTSGKRIIAKGTIDTSNQSEFQITASSTSNTLSLSSRNGRRPLDDQSLVSFSIPLPVDFREIYQIPCKNLQIKYERTSINKSLTGKVKSVSYEVFAKCSGNWQKLDWNRPYKNSYRGGVATDGKTRMVIELSAGWTDTGVRLYIPPN